MGVDDMRALATHEPNEFGKSDGILAGPQFAAQLRQPDQVVHGDPAKRQKITFVRALVPGDKP
jgi:hypothetical protein